MAFFDNLDIENFMGLVLKESSTQQVKETLCAKGISFKEYPNHYEKNENLIVFPYRLGSIDWGCRITIKNDVLSFVQLDIYNPDSYIIFKTLCKELSERYRSICEITNSQDKQEGTETMNFINKNDFFQFTEVVYDSSPILGQKNIRINYFK